MCIKIHTPSVVSMFHKVHFFCITSYYISSLKCSVLNFKSTSSILEVFREQFHRKTPKASLSNVRQSLTFRLMQTTCLSDDNGENKKRVARYELILCFDNSLTLGCLVRPNDLVRTV